jgi:long-chain acyl-CoA synthetase
MVQELVDISQEQQKNSELVLRRLLAAVAAIPLATITADTRLDEDAGLDSLQRVALLGAIESEMGVYLDETQAGSAMTVGELEALLASGADTTPPPALPHWPRARLTVAARATIQWPIRWLLRTLGPTTISGRELLDDLVAPVLLVANHTSHLDTPVLLAALPGRLRRRLAVAAAADYFFSRPWLGKAMAFLFNAFPFSRTNAVRAALTSCRELLGAGWSILLYPEGTRSVSGQIGAFQPGAGLLACELGVPVVPVWMDGLQGVLPKGRRWPRRGRVVVRLGAPLRFSPGTSYATASAAIEVAVRALAEPPSAAAPKEG